MVEIMSAESVTRETIRKVLEREIPIANEAIQDSREKGLRTAYVKQRLSTATIRLLEKAGYYVDSEPTCTEISWEARYNQLIDDEDFIEQLASELNVKIVDCESKRNTIDRNWKPPKYEDD